MGFSDFKHSDNGDNYLERKDLLEGLRLANRYIRALQIDPTRMSYLLLAGEICFALNRPEQAKHHLQLLSEYMPCDGEAFHEISKLYLSHGSASDALTYTLQAKSLAPDNIDIIFQEALCLESLDRLADALASYDNYLFKKSNCPIGWYNRGLVLQRLDRLPEALQSCSFAYSLDDLFTEALFTLANLHADLNELDLAIECFEKLSVIEPGNAYAYYNLGAIYTDLKKYEKAIYNYTRFLEICPENSDAYNARGYCFLKTTGLEDALSDMRSAILYESPQVAKLRLDTLAVKKNHQLYVSRINKLKILTKHEPKIYISKLVDYLLVLKRNNEAIQTVKEYATKGIDKTFSLALLAKIYFILGNTILGYAMLSQAAPTSSDMFNNVKCLMPKTGTSKLFFALFDLV
ncbi:MAG: tetratricopeptide repeat protein [Ignavibacteriales bacterium]|nr:tetratricopeptide repeat protein [Ignavibacteriales bacterium]